MCKTRTIENTFYINISPSRAIIDAIFSLDRHIPTNTQSMEKNKQTIKNTCCCVYSSPSRAIIDGIFSCVLLCVFLCVHMCVPIENTFYIHTSPSRAISTASSDFVCVPKCVSVCSYVCSYRGEHILYKHLSQQSHHRRHLLLSCPGLPPPFFLLPTASSPSLQSLHRRGTPLLFELL